MAEFNKSLLIKLLRKIHIYNFVDSIDINEDKIDHILQEFYNLKYLLNYFFLS